MADMKWREAITLVLRDSQTAMRCEEIADQVLKRRLRTSVGATPKATIGAHISASIKYEADSPYLRVAPAQFALRESLLKLELTPSPAIASDVETPEQGASSELIHAIGMYWLRTSVHWTKNAKLLGCERPGAEVVDFSGQRGVYLLHDGREVIYVGRSTDRSISVRLFEHTVDRHRARWDRFSWFGLYGVREDGTLSPPNYTTVSTDIVAATLEAVLIEGLEPRQNRKRGDALTAIEYIQVDDPNVEKLRLQELFSKFQSKLD